MSATDWVKNGDRWQIETVDADGALRVRHLRHRLQVRLPADYVAALGRPRLRHHDPHRPGHHRRHHARPAHRRRVPPTALHHGHPRPPRQPPLPRGRRRRRRARHHPPRGAHPADRHRHPDRRPGPRRGPGLGHHPAARGRPIPPSSSARQSPATRRPGRAPPTTTSARTALARLDRTAEAIAARPHRGTGLAHPARPPRPARRRDHGERPSATCWPGAAAPGRPRAPPTTGPPSWTGDSIRVHRIGPGPLPWLPAVPAALTAHPTWGPYLTARAAPGPRPRRADRRRRPLRTRRRPGPGTWTSTAGPDLLADLALWRAAHQVPDTDRRPTGPRQLTHAAATWQHRLQDRLGGAATPWPNGARPCRPWAPAGTSSPRCSPTVSRPCPAPGYRPARLLRTAAAEGPAPGRAGGGRAVVADRRPPRPDHRPLTPTGTP